MEENLNQKNFIIKIFLVTFIFILLIGCGQKENAIKKDPGKKESQSSNEIMQQQKAMTQEGSIKRDFNQGEIVVYKNVEYSILQIEKIKGVAEQLDTKIGYNYYKVSFRFENKSDLGIFYNCLCWEMTNSREGEKTLPTFSLHGSDITGEYLVSGNINPGNIKEGYMIWERKPDDNNLNLRFYETSSDSDYVFQFVLDN